MTLFRWKHIADLDFPDTVYLSRLFLVKLQWLGLYFHIIRRPDYARCEHNHPWWFITVVLWGGYEEEVNGRRFVRRPGYVGFRSRTFTHRITRLRNGPSYTFVIRGYDFVHWGFRTIKHGFLMWEEYVKLPERVRVLWCNDDDRP